MEYKLENNEYHLYNNGEFILNAGNEVSISYTYSNKDKERRMAVLFKHGSLIEVKKRHDDFINRMMALNESMKEDVFDTSEQYMITGKFDLEDLNKALSICDYIGIIHEKYIIN